MISESYEQEDNPLFGVIRFVRAVRERKIIPMICVGVFCLTGMIYYVVSPKVYEAKSDILLSGRNNRDDRLLTCEPVLSNLVQELADEKISELETLPKTLWIPYIRNHLSVKSPGGRPDILNLRYDSRNPQSASAILNRLVAVYVSYLNLKRYESVEMVDYRNRLYRLLSKDISSLIGATPQSGDQPTNPKDASNEKRRDVQNKLTLVEFPPELLTPGIVSGPGSNEDEQPAGSIVQVTLTLSEPQKKTDDATNQRNISSITISLSAEATQRLDLLQDVIAKLDNLKTARNIKKTVILSRATVPAEPASPLKLTTMLPVLGFLGFGLGLGIIYVLNAVDDRFSSPGDLSRRLGLPILEIIQKKTHLSRFATNRTPLNHSLKEVEFKEFDSLRVTLDLVGEKSNVLVVSSVDSKAGKTTVSAGLATAFAQSGKRTLLIDSDYHNGKLSQSFDDNDQAGLSRILSVEIPVSDAAEENILRINGSGLEFLPCGNTDDNSTNLLTTKRFPEFLSWCETRYDRIVIDAPAALDSCDASILGEAADGIIMVVTPQSTTRSRMLKACCNLETLGCRLIGVVANQLEPHNSWITSDGYGYQGFERQSIHHNSGGRSVHESNSKNENCIPIQIEKYSESLKPDDNSSINNQRVA